MSTCQNTNCGCKDTGLTTPAPCFAPGCPIPEPCAETWSDCCVIHNNDAFTWIDPQATPPFTGFTVLKGDRLCDILQKFLVYIECTNPTTTDTPYGLKSTAISGNSITVSWTPVSFVTTYTVYYAPVATGIFTPSAPITPTASPSYTLTGLTPNTAYYIYVVATAGVIDSCPSVSLIVTTL